MQIVGTPSFDWHFRKDLVKTREEFCKDVGIDPSKHFVLYGAMEYYWYRHDADIAIAFNTLVKEGHVPKDLLMLFRPYPGYEGPIRRIEGLSYVVPDMKSFTLVQGDGVEMREKHVSHLINSIIHSEMVVSVASTIGLDGIALGKPAIAAAFEEDKVPYWESIDRFRTHDTHFMEVYSTGGMPQARSKEEFARLISHYLENSLKDEEKRRVLKEWFIDPYDGRSGERVARILLKAVGVK
jgi:hypothetical protein